MSFTFSGSSFPASTFVVMENWERSSLRRWLTVSSNPPKPLVSMCPLKLTVAKSESWTLSWLCAAHPPWLEKSCKRNSFAHTSTLRGARELLRTPIIMVRTSPNDGLPCTLTLFLGRWGSYSENNCVNAAVPCAFFRFLLAFKWVNKSRSTSSIFSCGHTAPRPTSPP